MKSYKYIIVLLGYFLLFSLSVRVYANDPFKMVYPILSDTVINKFMNGIYDDRFIVNVDDYNIVNIVQKIIQLKDKKYTIF